MLSYSNVKAALQTSGLSRRDSFLLVLSTFDQPVALGAIKDRASELGFKIPRTCNPSSVLARAHPLVLNVTSGYEVSEAGLRVLMKRFPSLGVNPVTEPLEKLRSYLDQITDDDTREFVREAIGCCEAGLLKSSLVMSWLAAIYVLQMHVISFRLAEFNATLSASNQKHIVVRDDFRRLKESLQIDYLVNAKIVESSVAKELRIALDRRNNCGHPGAVKYEKHTVASQLEVLLQNVFSKFPPV